MIIRGTTPTLTFHVKNEIDLNEIAQVWITFKTKVGITIKEKTYDIEDVTIEDNNISLNLTQEDTLEFTDQVMLVQLRVRLNNDVAYASSIMEVDIGRILKEGVI